MALQNHRLAAQAHGCLLTFGGSVRDRGCCVEALLILFWPSVANLFSVSRESIKNRILNYKTANFNLNKLSHLGM